MVPQGAEVLDPSRVAGRFPRLREVEVGCQVLTFLP